MAGLKEEGPVVEKEAVLRLTTFLIDKVNLVSLVSLVNLVILIFGVGSVKVVFILTTALRESRFLFTFHANITFQGEDPTSYKFTVGSDEINFKVILLILEKELFVQHA